MMLKWLSDWWYGKKAASPFEVAGISPSGAGPLYESPEEYLMAMTMSRAMQTGNMVVGCINDDGTVTIEEVRPDNAKESNDNNNSQSSTQTGSVDDNSAYISDFRLR